MRWISRQILICALIFVFLLSACGRLALGSPTPVWTVTPAVQPLSPTATVLSSSTPVTSALTPAIPITGENVVLLQCAFCVQTESHVVLIFPDFAYFDVSSDVPVSCLTADVRSGKRILICHGTQSTTFDLNICSDSANCLQFPVALQPCPLLQAGASTPLATNTLFVPYNLTPIKTRKAPTEKSTQPAGTAIPSSTPTPGGASNTSTPAVNTPTTPLPTLYSSGPLVNVGQ
jgi:hypothetical protein